MTRVRGDLPMSVLLQENGHTKSSSEQVGLARM